MSVSTDHAIIPNNRLSGSSDSSNRTCVRTTTCSMCCMIMYIVIFSIILIIGIVFMVLATVVYGEFDTDSPTPVASGLWITGIILLPIGLAGVLWTVAEISGGLHWFYTRMERNRGVGE